MTDFASGFEIKIPHGSGRNVFVIRNKLISKGELKLAASAHLPQAEGASTDRVTTNSAIEINRAREISAGASIEATISDEVKAGISAGINLSALEEVFDRIAAADECSASHFSPLISGLNASIGFGNASMNLGWDSDLCFLTAKGAVPLQIGNSSIVPEGTLQFGLHESQWVLLFAKLAARAPSPPAFILKIKSVLTSLFGRLTLRIVSVLRVLFAGIQNLAPFLWAIDIALALRDLTVWLVRREQIAGYRSGQLVAFCTSFTKTICNHYVSFETGEVGELQRHGAAYAHLYHGRSRVAVQRYLSLFYNDARSIVSSNQAQKVGINFGIGMDQMSDEAATVSHRRPITSRTIAPASGSYLHENSHISRQINNYFHINIDRWVRDWDS